MAYLLGEPTVQQYFDVNGDPLVNGTVEFYVTGTSTPATIYSDSAGTAIGTSVTLNTLGAPENSGTAVALFFDDQVTYKIIRKDASGTPIAPTIDPYKVNVAGENAPYAMDVIATLQANTNSILTRVALAGHTTEGDGGGGDFWFDTSDTSTADDNGINIVDAQSPRTGTWKRIYSVAVNAAWFGGAADSAAVSAAEAIQHKTDLMNGNFSISGISLSYFGSVLAGDSQYTTVLGANADNITVLNTNNFSGIQVKNMRLVGTGQTSIKGLEVNNSFYSIFENIDVRGVDLDAITLINSNDNVFNAVQVHSVDGDGFVIDATSQHNTFNACGTEDFSGIGFDVNGIGNIFNAPWIENRSSASAATDVGMDINNRDNVVLAPEIRGESGFAMNKGIVLGASSSDTLLVNPHFSNVTTEIELLGTNLYRILQGVEPSAVTNTGGDTTSLIQRGNHIYTDMTWVSSAPVLNFESENGTSGVRFNLEGSASDANFRWQVGGTTYLQLNNDKHFTPGVDNSQNLGSASLRWATVYAGTGIINTSDEALKTDWSDIEAAEKAAALEIKQAIRRYRWVDAVDEKGDAARWHWGLGAQTVKDIMSSHGLDAHEYGFFCYDEALTTGADGRYGLRHDEMIMFILAAM